MFVDEINLTVQSGAGGSGAISFGNPSLKTKPSGGSGGDGGSVIFKVDSTKRDLSHILSNSSLKAGNGSDGNKNLQNGKKGEDLVIPVPKGTQILFNNVLYADLHSNDSEFIFINGSKGGRGNYELQSKRIPNPTFAENGQKRKKYDITISFSIYSDLAIIGLPNAGKSTLIGKLTNSKAQVANYEFTTTSPNLGVINESEDRLIICDLPGIIKGAADGIGMGKKILRHLRNTKLLIYLLDPTNATSIEAQDELISSEILTFDPNLSKLPVIKVLNKNDISKNIDSNHFSISCLTQVGLPKLIDVISEKIDNLERTYSDYERITLHDEKYEIIEGDGSFVFSGDLIEKLFSLNGSKDSVLEEIFYRFETSNLSKEVESLGITDGDTIVLGNLEFEYKK